MFHKLAQVKIWKSLVEQIITELSNSEFLSVGSLFHESKVTKLPNLE